ncbi:MAG: hypothetical protein ACOC2Q_04795, partial [Spirochaetota bacterium]
MPGWVAVLVDNKELVRFARLREGARGALNLTTMLPDQDRASVEIHLVNGRDSTHIHTFHAEDIRGDGRRPEIVVSSHVRDRLNVALHVDGELVGSEEFTIPAAMSAFRPGPPIAILLGLLAVLALGWGVWWMFSGIDAPGPRERVAEMVVLEDEVASRVAPRSIAPSDAAPSDPASPDDAAPDDAGPDDVAPSADPGAAAQTPPAADPP